MKKLLVLSRQGKVKYVLVRRTDADADSGVDLKLGSDCGCLGNLKNVRHHFFDFFQMSRFLLDFIPSIGNVASEFITCMNHTVL